MLSSLCRALIHSAYLEYKKNKLYENLSVEFLNDSIWKASRFDFNSLIYDEVSDTDITMKDFILMMYDYCYDSLKLFGDDDIITRIEYILNNGTEHDEQIKMIAELAKPLIECAGNGNEIALSILQEATHSVANYIKQINEELHYTSKDLVLAGNGSVINNDVFRKSINDELCFDYSDIKWTFSKISSAYGAAIMAGRLFDVHIKISDILKGKTIA